MSLHGKVAIVTGGATGIGFGTVKVLAERGVRVAIVQRGSSRGHAAVKRIASDDVISCDVDIRDRSAIQRCVDQIVEKWNGVDILVNNASVTGSSALSKFVDASSEHIDLVLDTNIKGTIYFSQAVARRMIESGQGGSIIHVSSVGAYGAQENASIYCASKAAQVMLTKGMALELAPHRIRVNCVAPGDIYTETSANVIEEVKGSGATGQFLRLTPMGRRGTAEEIGRAIAFLASDDASFVTGSTLLVDGGFLAY